VGNGFALSSWKSERGRQGDHHDTDENIRYVKFSVFPERHQSDLVLISVAQSTAPLSDIIIASSRGLLSAAVPASSSLESFNASGTLKLGPPPITDKLKEQVARNLQDSEAMANGNGNGNEDPDGHGSQNGSGAMSNGHNAGDGDIEMDGSGGGGPSSTPVRRQSRDRTGRSPTIREPKLENDIEPNAESDLISPTETETIPPIPPVFRLADLKREVEAVKDKRKMIRLGKGAGSSTDEAGKAGISPVLPSVLATTLFDGGEG
jgi:transcription initiation factor TFIID subunit 5